MEWRPVLGYASGKAKQRGSETGMTEGWLPCIDKERGRVGRERGKRKRKRERGRKGERDRVENKHEMQVVVGQKTEGKCRKRASQRELWLCGLREAEEMRQLPHTTATT